MTGIRIALGVLTTLGLTAGVATAGTPRLIDTVGLYETELAVYMAPNAKPAWVPQYKFIVEFDGYAQEDVVLVQWKRGGKAIGKPHPCSATAAAKDAQVNPQQPVYPVNLALFDCRHPNDAAITKAGTFTLDLVYKQTLETTLTPLGTLEMKVIELKQGSQNKQTATWTVSHDHRLGMATIEESVNGARAVDLAFQQVVLQHNDASRKASLGSPTHYSIRFWTKFKQGGPNAIAMACLLDGKRVVEARHTGGETRSYWTFQGKDKESGEWSQQVFSFYKSRVYKQPGITEDPDVWVWSEHPGTYRCVATAGGETVSEVSFTIGTDGAIVDSACQAQVATLRHIHVVSAKPGAHTNTTLDAAASKKAYFGHVVWKKGCPQG